MNAIGVMLTISAVEIVALGLFLVRVGRIIGKAEALLAQLEARLDKMEPKVDALEKSQIYLRGSLGRRDYDPKVAPGGHVRTQQIEEPGN